MKKTTSNFVAKSKDILGSENELPLKHLNFQVEIMGARATIEVSQRFENNFKTAVDVEYLFPILSRSCLLEFTAATDDQTYVGIVGEKEKVEEASKKLKEKGVTHVVASNFQDFKDIVKIFIANLQAKQTLLIQLKFSVLLDVLSQSTFRFRLPVVLLERLAEKQRTPPPKTKAAQATQDDQSPIQHTVETNYSFSFNLTVFKESATDVELNKLEPFSLDELRVTNFADKKCFTLISEKEPPTKDIFFIFKRIGGSKLKTVGDSLLSNILSAQLLHAPTTIEQPLFPRCAYGNFVLKTLGRIYSTRKEKVETKPAVHILAGCVVFDGWKEDRHHEEGC